MQITGISTDIKEELSSTPSAFLINGPYPNPTNASVHFQITSSMDTYLDIIFYNITGNIVLKNRYALKSGINSITQDLNDLPSSIYIIHLINDQKDNKRKLILMK